MVVRHGLHKNCRILLVGDRGVGKTSLILSLVGEEFPEDVPAKSEEITIPADITPELVPTNIVDYSAVEQSKLQLCEEIQKANVICVVYSVDDDDTLDRVTSYWLPFIRDTLSHTSRCPIVLVGNKTDLVDYSTVNAAMEIMNDFKEVESFVECSSKSLNNVSEIFYYAQKAVLHPTAPLFVSERQDLTEPCKKALTRIFKLCDLDNDGLLNDTELNNFQKRCFEMPLRQEALDDIKALLKRNISGGVSSNNSITLSGFLFLHCLFLQRGRSNTAWAVLRHFGYNDHLRLDKSFLHPKINVPEGSTTELSIQGQRFLKNIFNRFDKDKDGALSPSEQENLFSTCPAPPWGSEISHVVPTNSEGWVTAQGFLSFWVLTTLLNHKTTLEYLAYLGYHISETENQTSAIIVTREKSLDLLKKQSTRNVYECHVFGDKDVGKSTICQALLGHSVEMVRTYVSNPPSVFTINTVLVYGQEKYLVLKDMDVYDLEEQLPSSDINCDVVCLVYDCSNPNTFSFIASLYKKAYSDNKIPVLIVGNKTERYFGSEIEQHCRMQPAEFCDKKCLAPPHYFLLNQSRQKDLFIKLATMSAFPHLKDLSLLSTDSIILKAGIGISLVLAIGFFIRFLKTGKR